MNNKRSSPTIVEGVHDRHAQASARLGTLLGDRYRLEAVAGVGGQAWVYRAHDQRATKDIAVKLLRPELRGDDTALRRFKRERDELARLPHTNVVKLLDHGLDEQLGPWIATEYLEGETLASQLARDATVSATKSVVLLLQILEPVGILHAEGRAHRDLKPSNIFLHRKDGELRPVLLDFGVCFRPSSDSGADRLTQDGEAVGTLGYLAPEALYSTPTGVALLDVWAIAAILVEMVTGKRVVPKEQGAVPVLRSAEEWEEHLSDFENRSDHRLMCLAAQSLSVDLADRPRDARVLSSLFREWLRSP